MPTVCPQARPAILAALLGATALAGCTHVPELNNAIDPGLTRSNYPELIPLDQALIAHPSPVDAAREVEDELAARRASLQKRASDLNNQGAAEQ